MGRTITPKYVLEFSGGNYRQTPSVWKGRIPNEKKLEQIVMEYVVSTYSGFCNEEIGQKFGISIPSRAVIRENKPNGSVLVEWRAPMFLALPEAKDFPRVAKR